MCFAFVTPILNPEYPPLNVKEFNDEIVKNALRGLGVAAESAGRNDLLVDGKKVSGSAFEVDLFGKKNHTRVLHHGTILLEVDLDGMVDYLSPNIAKLKSKVS